MSVMTILQIPVFCKNLLCAFASTARSFFRIAFWTKKQLQFLMTQWSRGEKLRCFLRYRCWNWTDHILFRDYKLSPVVLRKKTDSKKKINKRNEKVENYVLWYIQKSKKHQEPYSQLKKKQLCCKKGHQHHPEEMHLFEDQCCIE